MGSMHTDHLLGLPGSTVGQDSMSAEVGAWEPAVELGEEHANALDSAAGDDAAAGSDRLHQQIADAAPSERAEFFESRDSARLIEWLRVLVLAEAALAGSAWGAKSPAIDVARLLRRRGDYPAHLTAWIRSVSSNRYLPYGSLLDRLR